MQVPIVDYLVLDGDAASETFLSEIIGAEVWLKFENLQFTAAYKERGALNKLLLMDPRTRSRGVIAASAGNHGQGVALAAKLLQKPFKAADADVEARLKTWIESMKKDGTPDAVDGGAGISF